VGHWVVEGASCHSAERLWSAGAVEVEGTASREGWTWAEVEACIVVGPAAVAAGAKLDRRPWPRHGAVGRTDSWSVAWCSPSSAAVMSVSWGPRDR
jgi:hypothetical protein